MEKGRLMCDFHVEFSTHVILRTLIMTRIGVLQIVYLVNLESVAAFSSFARCRDIVNLQITSYECRVSVQILSYLRSIV